jgi:RNA polymerase sigma factor (sigma-70 family)
MQAVAPGYDGKAWEASNALIETVVAPWRSYVDRQTVEDLRQEARLGAWRAVQTYDPRRGVTLGTYVYSCIKYAVLDAVQAYRHDHEGLLSLEEADADECPVAPADPLDDIHLDEWSPETFLDSLSREELCAAYRALEEQDQQIIAWALGAGQTDRQIAERLRRNEEWTKKRRQRAIQTMREHLRTKGERPSSGEEPGRTARKRKMSAPSVPPEESGSYNMSIGPEPGGATTAGAAEELEAGSYAQ